MADRNGGGQIAEELRALVSDAETLLRSTANAGGADMPDRAQATLQDLRARLAALEDQVRARARDVDVVQVADVYSCLCLRACAGEGYLKEPRIGLLHALVE